MEDRVAAKVLLTGFEPGEEAPLVAELQLADFEPVVQTWSDEVLGLLSSEKFDAVIVRFPLPGAGLGVLLSSVRAKVSLSRSAGLLILAPPDDVLMVRGLVGRGVNRVLPTTVSPETAVMTLEEVHGVAPRYTLRMPVQLEVKLPSRFLKAYCQTENLSSSGMLLRGFSHYPSGTVFSFEVQIPGGETVIKGRAEITRTTDAARENLEGFAARFLEVEDGGRDALFKVLAEAAPEEDVN